MCAPIGGDDRTRAQVARLVLLRQHPILGLEVMSGVGDELRVAWMIDGFHTDDNLHQPGIMLADVLNQLGFGIGRARNENCAGVRDRLSDSLKKGVILRGVPTPDGVCLVMDVLGRTIRVQHEPFHISRAEMEHACLMVIDPNDRMKVMAVHGISPFADRSHSSHQSDILLFGRWPCLRHQKPKDQDREHSYRCDTQKYGGATKTHRYQKAGASKRLLAALSPFKSIPLR
jgi:hypothetical protein